jgi:hypothetical protein
VFALTLLSALPAAARPVVNIDEVRDMAFSRGIVQIKEVELNDGVWEVEGFDAGGAKMAPRIKVHARSWHHRQAQAPRLGDPRPASGRRIATRRWGYRNHQSFFCRHGGLY